MALALHLVAGPPRGALAGLSAVLLLPAARTKLQRSIFGAAKRALLRHLTPGLPLSIESDSPSPQTLMMMLARQLGAG